MIRLNDLAQFMRGQFRQIVPVDTGNLLESVGSVGGLDGLLANERGFLAFNSLTRAPYGAILNEAQTINWRIRNPRTGQVYEGSYPNKHYKWVDNFAETFANELPLYINARRVQ